ncbi:MAG TPA: sigma-54 dependent transcriptional regulator [Bdellovibrionota bacterium]|nr:sigma-54 dependent transcriptional regulator [Bdellovibrionota bacterium]
MKDPPSKAAPLGRVAVIDDDTVLLSALERYLSQSGYSVLAFGDPRKAVASLESQEVDLVLTDVCMPDVSGIDLCREIKQRKPDIDVVVMTGAGSIAMAVDAMKAGAYDFLTKPFDSMEVVVISLTRAMERRRLLRRTDYLERQVELTSRFENIVGVSAKMKTVFRLIERVSPSESTILITGESGTGKELVAKAVFERGSRAARPFLAINCSAFSETLLESELFGHVKGAFTGATARRIGLVEAAHGGTLFLDEIGDMSLATQVKFLRVLQEGEVRSVGSNEVRKIDVRFIAATNVDLPSAVKSGRFREDLFYRLNVINIPIPPLRERTEDIPLLVHHFIRKHAQRTKKILEGIEPEALALLCRHRWPGNVRELENIIERAVVLSRSNVIRIEDLPSELAAKENDSAAISSKLMDVPYPQARDQVVDTFTRRYLQDVLARAGGVIAEAARIAGMDRSNFRRLLGQHSIDAALFHHE